jgi:hypothetical protein
VEFRDHQKRLAMIEARQLTKRCGPKTAGVFCARLAGDVEANWS